jgi:HD-like signal output (HDOD) protein/ActR/RegA family two-component response regulator
VKHLLLVDDDPAILAGLQRVLRRWHNDWQVAIASSATEALERCESQPFAVVVTDMRMPGMDGGQLLHEIRRRQPETIRMVLSGEATPEAAMRAVSCAHQFLAKPCDATTLHRTLVEVCAVGELIADPDLRALVNSLGALPTTPAVYTALTELLERPNTDITDVAAVVSKDVAMSAKVLQLVNSAFFGLSRPATGINEAVAYLGVGVIQALALSAALASVASPAVPVPGFDPEALQERAQAVALTARRLAPAELRDAAFTAGLLAESGQLVLACTRPDDFAFDLADAEAEGRALAELQRERRGFDYGQVGAYLLGLWGIPLSIVYAVAHPSIEEDSEHALPALVAAAVAAVSAERGDAPQSDEATTVGAAGAVTTARAGGEATRAGKAVPVGVGASMNPED